MSTESSEFGVPSGGHGKMEENLIYVQKIGFPISTQHWPFQQTKSSELCHRIIMMPVCSDEFAIGFE